jgi:hypothetical protein
MGQGLLEVYRFCLWLISLVSNDLPVAGVDTGARDIVSETLPPMQNF